MFLTSCNLKTCYKNVLIAVIAVARHYQRELLNLLPTGLYPFYMLKTAIETLEKVVKCVQSYIKDTKKTANDVVLVSSLLTLYIALVNSIEFEQLNAGWAEPF